MDFRELMLVPKGISSVQGQIRAAGEIDSLFREALKKRNGREESLTEKKQDAADGGVLKLLEKAVEEAGYQCGKEIFLQSMQELEDCMKSSREYIVFRQRADDADSGWNAHGRN